MKFITDEFRQPYDIDRKSPVGVCDLRDIPSKLVSKHTFPDNKESMYLENDLKKKNDFGPTILQTNKSLQILWDLFLYSVNLCIQPEYRKLGTRKNSVFGHFSRSASLDQYHQIYEQFLLLEEDFNSKDKKPSLSFVAIY